MSTRKQIEKYLIQNPVDRDTNDPYGKAAKHFNIDRERIRRIWRNLRQAGLVETESRTTTGSVEFFTPSPVSVPAGTVTTSGTTSSVTYTSATANIQKETNREIKNELDLAEECDIDLSVWEIHKWSCKAYNAWIKNKAGEIESQVKYSVYAEMKRKAVDENPATQKQVLLKELFDAAPELQIFDLHTPSDESPERNLLYEISIPDIHFGKLGWREESGEDYDLKIACQRFRDAISVLLSRVNLETVSRILFPIGNDMLNVDNDNNTTTAGTPQNLDGRFPKIVRVVKELLIEQVTRLATIAPVDVVVVPGNHDNHTMFTLGEILEAYFHNTEKVTIFNSPRQRKYYRYGACGFQYTHGNNEKHQELGLIFATEEPELWAATKYRYAKLGHLHKTKKLNYVEVDEFQGFRIEIMPSLSGTDKWHKQMGYLSNKAAKALLYHPEGGKVGEFYYNL